MKETARRNSLRDGYLRPIVTRGVGPLGLEATNEVEGPTVVVIPQVRRKFNEDIRTRRGLRAKVVSVRATPSQCIDPRVKSLNYVNNILGKFEQWDAGAEVGIMLSTDGYISEGCAENVFCVHGTAVRTSPATRALDGITRQAILQLAGELGLQAHEADLTTFDLYTADEVFVTGTLTEVVPVTMIDGRSIGDGVAGVITKRLLTGLRELMSVEGEPIYEHDRR